MQLVTHETAAVAPDSAETEGTTGYFTQGAPLLGVAPTVLTATWCNSIQNEIAHVITSQGITLNVNDNTQLLAAIQAIVAAAIAEHVGG